MVVVAYLAIFVVYAILLASVLQFGPLGIVPAGFLTVAFASIATILEGVRK